MNLNKQQKKEINRKIEQVRSGSRYTQDELSLISKAFLGEEDILFLLRKFFLQGTLLEWEKVLLAKIDPDTLEVIKRCLLPELNLDAPVGQANDLWISADMSQAMNKLLEYAYLDMQAQQIVIDYLTGQFQELASGKKNKIVLQDLIFSPKKEKERAFVELKARNMILRHIEGCMEELRILAIANADMTPEEKQKKLLMDSNK